MFCQKCGHEVHEEDKFCPYCGASQNNTSYTYFTTRKEEKIDTGNAGFAVVSFFFPIVGLILFLCWRKEKPKTAKQAGLGALASLAVILILGIFVGVCIGIS